MILLVFIIGCAEKIEQIQRQEAQDDSFKEIPPIPPKQGTPITDGCDGICDNFEKEHPESSCYKPDCLGISEPKKEEITLPEGRMQSPLTRAEISVTKTGSQYKTTSKKPTGWFTNNQDADMLLSGVDFNNAGSSLFFNHQGGIATDGKHLILADRNNNRILIWDTLPEGNTPPDVVLGQRDFTNNNPGNTIDKLNWPVAVATDGKHVLVADTYNDRLLIWNTFPTKNGQSADISLEGPDPNEDPHARGLIGWPWAVWTNGEKVILASTAASQVLIWNTFPNKNNQKPDIVLKLEEFGTPRTIGSDGTNLVVGDHNAFKKEPGNFFWKSFPTKDDQKYDFFMENVNLEGQDMAHSEIFWGPSFTSDGKFVFVSDKLHIWEKFPENENDAPDLSIGGGNGLSAGYNFGASQSGDGSGIALAGEKLYISLCNGNKVVGFKSFPERFDQMPDFAVGSPDIYTNTLETGFIISNPVPSTDGNSLFVSSDFDRKLYVWKALPDERGAKPDFVYNLPDAPWDNALYDNVLALAGKQTVFIWKSLPINGEEPDIIFRGSIGSVEFGDIGGIAIDEKYFYLADNNANKIYVWEGIPEKDSEPLFAIDSDQPARMSSNGEYLAVAATLRGPGGSVVLYKISGLPNTKPAVLNGMFNLPQGVLVYDNHLFVGDTGFNTVHIWDKIEDAISGKEADTFLSEKSLKPKIGRNSLFWPAVPAFDGSHLWIGEFKFSERLMRFSVGK